MLSSSRRAVFFFCSVLVLFCSAGFSQPSKPLTLEAIFVSKELQPRTLSEVQWLPDGSAFTYLKSGDLYKQEIAGGKETLLLSQANWSAPMNGATISFDKYQWSGSGKHLLIASNERKIWRHSTEAQYYIYDFSTKKLRSLSGIAGMQRNAKFSPDGGKVGFVRHNNIFVMDLAGGLETQITFDGSDDLINGRFDWVYEEEFGLADGWRWSPDSKRIAYWRLDQTQERPFPLEDMGPLYPSVFWLKYPKAGEKNALVQVHVYDLDSRKTQGWTLAKRRTFTFRACNGRRIRPCFPFNV